MLDESVPDTSVTEHSHDISELDESRSLDVSDYVQLLENPNFVDPQQRREELETEVSEIEDDDILEQEPMAMPDELFSTNDTDSYSEMFSAAGDNLFSGCESEQENENSDENKPLYRNAPLTVAESLLLVVTFAIRFTLACEQAHLIGKGGGAAIAIGKGGGAAIASRRSRREEWGEEK